MTTQQPNNTLPEKRKDIFEATTERVNLMLQNQELRLPKGYIAENAIKSAYLEILELKDKNDKPALDVADNSSIANALMGMVLQGLNPALNQCSFIMYGKKLTLVREYQGTIAVTKRFGGLKMAYAEVIYKGDEFEYRIDTDTGKKVLVKHEQKFENISTDAGNILGAYAVLHFRNGEKFVEIMTMPQIRQAWMQGKAKGASPAHKNFPDQMAKKTVISRACKPFVSSSIESGQDEFHDAGLDPDMEVKANDDEYTDPQKIRMLDGDEMIDPYVVGDPEPKQEQKPEPKQDPDPNDGQKPKPRDQAGMFDDNQGGPGF